MKAYYEKSKSKPKDEITLNVNDDPTRFNNPWLTILINFVGILILGKDFNSINSSYFASVAVLVFPLFLNYLRFTPRNRRRKVVRRIGIVIHAITLVICLMGIFGVMDISVNATSAPLIEVHNNFVVGEGIKFSARYLYGLMFASFFFVSIDPFLEESKFEKDIKETIKTKEKKVA